MIPFLQSVEKNRGCFLTEYPGTPTVDDIELAGMHVGRNG